MRSPINFKKVKVIVADLSERERLNDDFINQVKLLMDKPPYKAHFNDHLILVPVADLLSSSDYYILDTHFRASGHRKIAERLTGYIN